METVRDDKSVLRRKYKDIRASFRAGEGRVASASLRLNLERFLADYPQIPCALYRARREEAPCPLEPVTKYYYPKVRGEVLEFRRPESADAFELSSLSISEPIESRSVPMDVTRPMVVCCPALAVDSQGGRLGMGKGHYDRFFAKHPHALRVGIVFQVQVSADPLPGESWDQQLDWIVTDKMILRTSTSTRSS